MSEVAPSVRCSAFAASNTTATVQTLGTLVIPITVAPGDCLILVATSETYLPSSPAGWTQIVAVPSVLSMAPDTGMAVWWKTATATDPGATLLTNVYGCAGLAAYQNAGGSVPMNTVVSYPYLTAGFNTPIIPSVPASATVFQAYGVFENTNDPTLTIAGDLFACPFTPQGQVCAPNGYYGTMLGFFDVVQVSTGAGPATAGAAYTPYAQDGVAVSIAIPPMLASYTPTLVAPVNNSTADLALTPTFTWGYNPSLNNGAQSAYAFRRKIAGASAYEYWIGASSTWGAITWNSSAANSIAFPAGKWTDGNTYNWSAATQDAITGLQGAFAQDFIVIAQQAASVVVNAPSGYTLRFDPFIAWTGTFPGAFVQIGYRAVVYSAAQYGAVGFVPGLGPSVWDSGPVAGTATLVATLIPGTFNGVAMRAYVQVIETNNDPSPWAHSSFTLEVDAPAAPTLTATPGTDGATGAPLVAVVVNGHDNLLTLVDASVGPDTGTWVAGTNTAIAQSGAQAYDGDYSLALTATAGGAVSAHTGVYPVIH